MEVVVGGGGGDEGLRCVKLSSGGMWKCNVKAMSGEVLCEKHYLSAHRRKMNKRDGGENSGVVCVPAVDGGVGLDGVRKRGRPKGSKKKVLQGNGCGIGSGKRGRSKGLNYRKKIGAGNEVEAMQVDPRGGGVWKRDQEEMGASAVDGGVGLDGVTVRKRGRPKGSKKKILQGNGCGIGSGKRGRPKGSKNRKKIGTGIEVEAMQVDPHGGGEIVSMNSENGATVGAVREAGRLFDTDDVMQSVSKISKSGGLMFTKDNGDLGPEVQKKTNEGSCSNCRTGERIPYGIVKRKKTSALGMMT